MFKRRRPDDPTTPTAPPTATESPADRFPPATPPDPRAATATPADGGVAIPPFRPTQGNPQEISPMGRAPFAPNQPAPQPVPQMPPPPRPQMGNQMGGPMGGPMQPGPGPQDPGARPRPQPSDRRTLVVGRGISVQGVVQDAERLVVEGTVEATMIHATELSVSPGGVFKGEVEVEDADIAGTIDGTLTARGNLIVRATGRVLGTARCRRLQVEDGGQITGRMEMLADAPAEGVRPEGMVGG